jgi:hypothetical protein
MRHTPETLAYSKSSQSFLLVAAVLGQMLLSPLTVGATDLQWTLADSSAQRASTLFPHTPFPALTLLLPLDRVAALLHRVPAV